eukprot:m.198507 g.198507  ORF g.198507 m.198507 type:complete len:79 (+) comp14922_c0_seq12:1581-1817(+)
MLFCGCDLYRVSFELVAVMPSAMPQDKWDSLAPWTQHGVVACIDLVSEIVGHSVQDDCIDAIGYDWGDAPYVRCGYVN